MYLKKIKIGNIAYHIKNQIEDEMLDKELDENDINILQEKSESTLKWLYNNQEEDNDIYRQKYDDLELEFKNILSKKLLYSNSSHDIVIDEI